jgi:hypothetical protein
MIEKQYYYAIALRQNQPETAFWMNFAIGFLPFLWYIINYSKREMPVDGI